MEIIEMEKQMKEWHNQKYGMGHKDIPATVRKLQEEVGEMIECIMNEDAYGAAIEAADVLFLLCTLVRHMDGNITLDRAVADKLVIIQKRIGVKTIC